MQAYASLYDIELPEIITDAGVSAKTLGRPGLEKALKMLEAREAEALVIVKLDRLNRSVRDLDCLLEKYFSERFSLMSVGEQVDTRTAAGRLVLNVLMSVAQWERETIGERTNTALQHKKAQGEYIGGVGFGYQVEDKKLVRAENHNIVEMIVQLRQEEETLEAIAKRLNESRVKTMRGGRWYAKIAYSH
ncbi:recombinase family protein [Synechocystis sp. LEGE 06083]|uniref:recombinase family protein n=1 Tax=Synechocystis sp. LEGE 06083 TaxID=915336 RepID=UPI0034CD2661